MEPKNGDPSTLTEASAASGVGVGGRVGVGGGSVTTFERGTPVVGVAVLSRLVGGGGATGRDDEVDGVAC